MKDMTNVTLFSHSVIMNNPVSYALVYIFLSINQCKRNLEVANFSL
jgi:hypothetical protein